MTNCTNIQLISQDEFIGDSLSKINTNFSLLSSAACALTQQYNSYRNIRTFFYYGPNSPTESQAGDYDENTQLKYPSPSTIVTFVSSTEGLDLLPISKKDDIAWVIYQKTGWATQSTNYPIQGSGEVPYTAYRDVPITRVIGIGGSRGKYTVTIGWKKEPYTAYQAYTWNDTVYDSYREYAPSFVIYKLVHDGTNYVVEGTPKFTRAQTALTSDWNNPELWNIYNI